MFRNDFYHHFSKGRSGETLSFEGYFRAVTIYGGEQRLLAKTKSVANLFVALRQRNLALINGFHREARSKGFGPSSESLKRTIFWDKPFFEYTEDDILAKRTFLENPQPPFAAKARTLPYQFHWPVCTQPWTPAAVLHSEEEDVISSDKEDEDFLSDQETEDEMSLRNRHGRFAPRPPNSSPVTPEKLQDSGSAKSVRSTNREIVDLTKEPQPVRMLDGMYKALDRLDDGHFNEEQALTAMKYLK
ncbi:uncharacterized protein CTRU02_203880 [Colletotrichum truncatum]|uniref:Uncharacterized protein n=1 Tax=Colletotrichum truncatum TaxID=5467 RepID=A0ACC3ZAG5_COLTU|nr:uncharacterized protein CTRU02_04214 [Colletotrichum truncatum]KAF6796253.1 hypothetical protein CTRU02_04214 [Colletotrichum truncatum]